MNYLFIVLAALLTCILYDVIPFKNAVTALYKSYQKSLPLLRNGNHPEMVIKYSLEQFKWIAILFIKIFFVFSPFLLLALYLVNRHLSGFLLALNTNILALATVFCYFLIRSYAIK